MVLHSSDFSAYVEVIQSTLISDYVTVTGLRHTVAEVYFQIPSLKLMFSFLLTQAAPPCTQKPQKGEKSDSFYLWMIYNATRAEVKAPETRREKSRVGSPHLASARHGAFKHCANTLIEVSGGPNNTYKVIEQRWNRLCSGDCSFEQFGRGVCSKRTNRLKVVVDMYL